MDLELLDWQHNLNNIKDRGLRLLQTDKWSDCSFLVGSAQNLKIFAGHKLILAMASPVFERMFFGQLAEKDNPIAIPDVQPDVFQAMLVYIYSDSIDISSFHMAYEMFYAAKKYMLPHGVELLCIEYLRRNLSSKTACRTYEFAKFFGETSLMNISMKNITQNTAQVWTDPNFTDIKFSTLMDILNQPRRNASELSLFNAVQRFANSNKTNITNEASQNLNNELMAEASAGKQSAIAPASDSATNDPSSSTSNNADNVNEVMIREAVKKINFLALTPQELIEGTAGSNLLEKHELLAILINIICPCNKDYPMPEGFSNSRAFFRNKNGVFTFLPTSTK